MCNVFLTDILGSHIADIFNDLMFSVVPAYLNVKRFVNYREKLNGKRIAYDSGGYHFLIGKIKQPPNPYRTIEIYEKLGYTNNDFLIQLDLPPAYFKPKHERLQLIRKSAEFYHIMLRKIKVLGVVHGWEEDELQYSLDLLESENKIAAGTYAATSVIASHAGQAEMVLQRTPRKVIFERLVNISYLLKNYEIFMLGCSNPNIIHIAFLLGVKFTDGGSWRLAAAHHVIFIPEHGRFSIGKKRISKRLTDFSLLKKYYCESPFEVSFNDFVQMLRSDFKVRALWNAWVLKYEEKIANEFATDPDKYHKYLYKRFEKSKFWSQVLRFVWSKYKQKYVQTDLRIFLKHPIGGV